MPPKNKKKTQRKKNPKSSGAGHRKAPTAGGRAASAVMLYQTPLFPPSTVRRGQLYYEYQLVMGTTLGVPTSYVFSANGAFDPNITGTGHQPMGFDQMMSLYDQYCVMSSSIQVTFAGLSTSVARVALMLYDQPVASTDPSRLVENGLAKMGVLATSAAVNAHYSVCTLNLHCDVGKYFGVPFSELKVNPSFIGTAAANPTEQVYFIVDLWGGFSATTMTLVFDVLLSYDIYYYEPRHIDVSTAQPLEKKEAPRLVSRLPKPSSLKKNF